MDTGTQNTSDNINVPKIINLLLSQQDDDKSRHEDRYYPFIPKHEKSASLQLGPLSTGVKSYRFNYVKVRRGLYDHARSLRHYEKGFSINNVLSFKQERTLKPVSPLKSKMNLKIREKFKDILRKTDLILNRTSKESEKGKSEKKGKLVIKRESKVVKRFKVEIPTVRAQTIVPCPRRKNHLGMVDAEITTDNTFSMFY